MKPLISRMILTMLAVLSGSSGIFKSSDGIDESGILSYIVDPGKQEIKFYWKNKLGENYSNFQNLRSELAENKRELVFAMNAGMYKEDQSPLGLYIENGMILSEINKVKNAYGNFYMQPNGIFYLTHENKAVICTTEQFENKGNIKYATQSGPMLLINGQMHPKFQQASHNVHIRNGVGILPNGKLLFAMSKEKINFYDFAAWFKQNGCQNALYLDGFVSRTYLPSKSWEQLDGNFGVMIGVSKATN